MKARKRDGAKLLNVLTGRGCFKIDDDMPQRLRVNTFSAYEWGKILDSAPGWRTYGAWVTSD